MAKPRPPTGKAPDVVGELVARGVRLVREYAAVEASKTDVLRDLARVVVSLRQCFSTDDGRTDWTGRSHGYRETIASVYSQAGIPPDSLDGMQAALRYHIGNVLRDVAPPDELEYLGLKSKTPKDRGRDQRDRLAALARVGAAQDGGGPVRADAVRMVTGAEVLLTRVADDALADLTDEGREAVVAALEAVVARASEMLADLEPKRGRRRGGRRRLRSVPAAGLM